MAAESDDLKKEIENLKRELMLLTRRVNNISSGTDGIVAEIVKRLDALEGGQIAKKKKP